MADITLEFIPERSPLPVNNDAKPDHGELNYIFYPGISECKHIRLTNNTSGALSPEIAFKECEEDEIWYPTMRIYTCCSGVLPSGVFDISWSGTIPMSGSQDLYLYSECTKEGFVGKYDGTYWTDDGLGVIDADYINDHEEQGAAIDCDAANANASLTLDLGSGNDKDFVRLKISIDAAVKLTFDIQYSDDDVTYTTVYADASLDYATSTQITHWWNNAGEHRYWRILKSNAAAAGGNITEVQWLLFDAHEGYDYGVYGDHKCYIYDTTGHMDDFKLTTSIMVNVDTFSRQNYQKPIGKVGTKTHKMMREFEKYGENIQLYYIPTMTFSYGLGAKVDFQLEKRVWDIKAIISPQKRNLTYTDAGSGIQPDLYRYDQRSIILPPIGPDGVGWYMTNYDFWHTYGHTYYILLDNHCYKVDDPQPIYFDDILVAFSARIFLQGDMTSLGIDPRNYVLSNRDGLFMQFPNGGYSLQTPTDWIDTNTPEQRPCRWQGAYITYVSSRVNSNRPNPYSLTETIGADTYCNGEVYETEVWNDPATTNYETTESVAFGTKVKSGASQVYFQMPRFYNWIGFADYTGNIDPVNCLVQCYYDEDCTIPVTLTLESSGLLTKVENQYDEALVTAGGLVTVTALGDYIISDGHSVRTPSKLYLRYVPEDGEVAYYYP